MVSWQTLDLEQARQLPDLVKGKGVYFLWRGDELLYIGASTNVTERVNRQWQFTRFGHLGSKTSQAKPRIPFDKATILKVDGDTREMIEIERALIKRWWPPYNEKLDGDEVWGGHIDADARDRAG